MSVHNINSPGYSQVLIRRSPNESQGAFDASKADAKYSVAGEQQTLILDGKLDGPIANQMSAGSEASLITDLRNLAKRGPELKAACQEADNYYLDPSKDFGNASPKEILQVGNVDLGTGTAWSAFPMSVISGAGSERLYNFSDSQGHQEVTVSFTKDDQMKLSLNSTTPNQDFTHTMSGLVGDDGTLNPSNESVHWFMV